MISPARLCAGTRAAGFTLYTGVPCSHLTPFIDEVIAASGEDAGMRYIGAADEGSAVAIASGASLGGERALVMLQNSGLGNAVSPLTSLSAVFEIPVLLVATLRGEPGGPPDEPQHALMGSITRALLELMGVPWAMFPEDEAALAPALAIAVETMDRTRRPYALLMRKGAVAARAQGPSPPRAPQAPGITRGLALAWPEARPSRGEMLAAVQAAVAPDDVVVATTGYTGRELSALEDRPNQLYVASSAGARCCWSRRC